MWESLGYRSGLVQSQDSSSAHPPLLAVPMAASLPWAAGLQGLPRADLGLWCWPVCCLVGLEKQQERKNCPFA